MNKMLLMLMFFFCSCKTTVPNRNPLGQEFPVVKGEALDGKVWSIPDDLKGKNVLLLIGYKQETQFDIDRWLIGIDQKHYKVDVFEIPTIKGWVPRLIAGYIDEGMRSGIPEDLWKIVVTVYADADKIVNFFGNENPGNARVVVIDQTGKIQFVYQSGFSVAALNELGQFFPSSNKENCK